MDHILKTGSNEILIEKSNNKEYRAPERRMAGPELEKNMVKAFTEQGWECRQGESLKADIALAKDGKILGFVDCYISQRGNAIPPKKQIQILSILEQDKPEIFILTNGITFETYFNGVYAGTMTVPLSYQGFSRQKRLGKYREMLTKTKEKKDGKNI